MVKLKEFFNKISNNNRIFTREDIGKMSSDEFRTNEEAIDYQLANLGVPTNSDMALSEDVVYVHSYTRDDGTKVKAHYRSKHGHITGGASNVNNNSSVRQNKVQVKEGYSQFLFDPRPNITKALNNTFYKGLSSINNNANKNYPDARDMMDISIYGPKNIQDTDNYKFVSSQFNEKLNKELNLKIPKNWDGIIYDINSDLSKSIANSPEFLNEVAKHKQSNFSKRSFLISLNKNPNLFRSMHNATVLNPHIDKDGYFKALIFDLYDFELNGIYNNEKYDKLTATNNSAFALQALKLIKNYYVLIPIKTKLPF